MRRTTRRPVTLALTALAILVVQVSALGLTGPLARAEEGEPREDTDRGTQISVVVVETSGRPSVVPPTRPGRPPGAGQPPTTPRTPALDPEPQATDTASPVPIETPEASPEGEDEVSIGGLLYVSGLSGSTKLEPNPFGGTHTLRFTVRNASNTVVEASAGFRLLNLFGSELGPEMAVEIKDLAPGEVREVSATLGGLAQWTLVKAETVFTPPERIGYTELEPVKRDQWVFFLPWFLLGSGAVTGAGFWLGPTVVGLLRGLALPRLGAKT